MLLSLLLQSLFPPFVLDIHDVLEVRKLQLWLLVMPKLIAFSESLNGTNLFIMVYFGNQNPIFRFLLCTNYFIPPYTSQLTVLGANDCQNCTNKMYTSKGRKKNFEIQFPSGQYIKVLLP